VRRLLGATLVAYILGAIPESPSRAAPPPLFDPPLACLANNACFIQKYFDHDPGPGFQDFQCGPLSGDGHKGTDFRLAKFEDMEKGAPVSASADGIVVATRNNMPDVPVALVGESTVLDRGLGNTVIIDHGSGWRSTYGHLKQGSVSVAKGDLVKRGDRLGKVGLSGLTDFPHVHFQINFKGAPVDPFTGAKTGQRLDQKTCERTVTQSLWHRDAQKLLPYNPSFLLHAGFSDKPMNRPALAFGLYTRRYLPKTAKNIFFGVYFAGAIKKDPYRFRLFEPSGAVFYDKSETIKKRGNVRFRYGGKRNRTLPWRQGRYRAVFDLMKGEKPVLSVERFVQFR
jgi:murein DD-endopeptidase MepM/ murein hydrolase activator NlpD